MAKKEPKIYKTYMYHDDCPAGKIFNSDEVEALEKKGWCDTPAQIKMPETEEDQVTEEVAKRFTLEDHKGVLEEAGFIVMTPEQLKTQANKMAAGINDIRADELKLSDLPDDKIREEVQRRGMDISVDHPTTTELAAENQAAADRDAGIVDAEVTDVVEDDAANTPSEEAQTPDEASFEKVGEDLVKGAGGSATPVIVEENPLDVLENRFNEDPEDLTKEELITLGHGRYGLKLKRTMKEATLIENINAALKGK